MLRAVSLLLGVPAMVAGLFVANWSGALSQAGTALAILAIIGFAVVAAGWTEGHDVSD